jgi:hypothetical protein
VADLYVRAHGKEQNNLYLNLFPQHNDERALKIFGTHKQGRRTAFYALVKKEEAVEPPQKNPIGRPLCRT